MFIAETLVMSMLTKSLEYLPAIILMLWTVWRANRSWQKKEFQDELVGSLNMIELYGDADQGGKVGALRLRTIFEKGLREMFMNEQMYRKVREAIKRTTEDDILLRFEEEDSWYILNAILNKVSEQFAQGLVLADLGGEVKRDRYLFCFTFERKEGMKQRKPRVLFFNKERFLNFPEEGEFDLEQSHHAVRVATLRELKEEYRKNPHLFMEMEIVL